MCGYYGFTTNKTTKYIQINITKIKNINLTFTCLKKYYS